MEEDIHNYSPTVMFRRTPCTLYVGPVFRRLRLEVCVKTGLADKDIRDLVGFTNVLQGNLILNNLVNQHSRTGIEIRKLQKRYLWGENILKNGPRDCLINTADIIALKMSVRKLVSRKSTSKVSNYIFYYLEPRNPKSIPFKFIFSVSKE